MTAKKNVLTNFDENKCRHILSLSGGKDSTALALYLRDRVPNMEYVFCDTGEELSETYEYLLRIEAQLGVKIIRLNPERHFHYYLDLYRGVLPDPRTRWCTRMLKLHPFEKFVGTTSAFLYTGIRADEPHRSGYISTKSNIKPIFPFVEDGIMHHDVLRILQDSGLGLPEYYKWRSRSGCYFCFFQQRREWIGLFERHPGLFWKAAEFEKFDPISGKRFTWNKNESLKELASNPERINQIKIDYQKKLKNTSQSGDTTLINIFDADDTERESCLICHL